MQFISWTPRIESLVSCIAVVLLAGCASITGSTNQSVSVQTRLQTGKEVVGSACELANNKGKWFVTTPGSVPIHRSNDDLQVICNKDGMDAGRAAVVSDTKGAMFGNILFGGGIGAIIDHSNGSAYEYPGYIQVIMGAFSRLEQPKAQDSGAVSAAGQAKTQPADVPASQESPTNALQPPQKTKLSKEQRLVELKVLFEKGLVSNEAFLDQQRMILAND